MRSSAWKVGTSVCLFPQLTEAVLRACGEARLYCVEAHLWGEWLKAPGGDPIARCGALVEAGEKHGVRFWSAHLPFGPEWDISAPDEADRKRIVGLNADLLKFAAALGAHKAVVHGSYEPVAPAAREQRLLACRDSLARLSERASAVGVQLALECLPRTCLANTTEETRSLIDGRPEIGVCCDTNHLLTGKPEDFIAELGPRIVTLHVSDYDGVDERHWLPGRGVNDWNAIVAALEGAGYDGPWMFEVSPAGDGRPVTPADLRACGDAILKERKC